MGGASGPGRSVPELRTAYDTGARLWAEGPEPAYASLARALLAQVDTGLAEPWASDPAALGRDTAAAGYTDVRLRTVTVDTGLSSPATLASWRLGMAHVAPFVGSLTAARRASLRRAAEAAVTGTGPLVVDMLVLTAS